MQKRQTEEPRSRAVVKSSGTTAAVAKPVIENVTVVRTNSSTHTDLSALPRRKKIYLIRRDKERKIQDKRKEQRLRKELGIAS